MYSNCFFENIFAPLCTHRVADAPSNNLAAVHINDCGHVHKALFHRYIGDVRTPNLVGMGNLQVSKQIRFDKLLHSRFGEVLAPVNRIPTHHPKQTTDTLWTYNKAHTHQ